MSEIGILLVTCTCMSFAFSLVTLVIVAALFWHVKTGRPIIAITRRSSTANQQWGERLVGSRSDPVEVSIRRTARRYRQQAEVATDKFQSDAKDFIDSWR